MLREYFRRIRRWIDGLGMEMLGALRWRYKVAMAYRYQGTAVCFSTVLQDSGG
jgi:hypothetical protein